MRAEITVLLIDHDTNICNVKFCVVKHKVQGRIQDFRLGGAHLNKLRRAEGGAKFFGVFRVKNHDFTPKHQYFFQF
jgi:hypothetical protein